MKVPGLGFLVMVGFVTAALMAATPLMAAQGDYTRENVANPSCDKR